MNTSENKQYKSTCLACGKEWYYTKKDLRQSEENQAVNEINKDSRDLSFSLGKMKISDHKKQVEELPEVAHQCPVCGSKSVSLEFVGEKKKLSRKAIIWIIAASIALLVVIALSICIPVSIHIRNNTEHIVTNIDFNGIDESSVPLSASDLKLFKKGDTYTVVATLKKNSDEPQEGYFEFDISLLDKNGKRIKSEHIDTMPTPDNTYSLFTYGSENYFEYDMYISSGNKPVQIAFSNIQECGKEQLIRLTLDKAKEYLSKQDLDNTKEYALEVLKYDPENIEAKALSGQLSAPEHTPVSPAPSTSVETSQSVPEVKQDDTTAEQTQATIPTTNNNYLIGSDKANVRKLLSKYKETKSIMSNNSLDFENNDLLITVYFNSNDIADGVLFMQNSFDGVDTLTGIGSYVSKHYDELVKLATNNPNIKVESDYTKYNSKGVKKAPMEIYIGNVPH